MPVFFKKMAAYLSLLVLIEIMAETIMKAEKGWLQRYELSFRKFEG